jgi:hypothetical protein
MMPKKVPLRPKMMKTELLAFAKRIANLGLNNKQIAQALGVTAATFTRWKKYNPEFECFIQQHKIDTIEKIVGNLVRQATMHNPNLGAMIYFLKTQAGDSWKENAVNLEAAKHQHLHLTVVKNYDDKSGNTIEIPLKSEANTGT